MKEEIKTIKEEVVILSHDQACIDTVIIKSAQDLLEKKIYLNYDKFKESAEFFLRESDNEFFSTLGSKWEPYFEKKIRKPLSKRLRSLRGTFNVAKASKIAAWKKKLAVSNYFKKNIPNLQIAWAISISEIFLNLKNEVIKMLEEIIQPALARNLRKIENEEGFEYELDSSPTPQRPVSPERQKDPETKERKELLKKVENNEYEGKKNDEYEGDEGEESEEGDEDDEGDEGEDDDDEDDEDEEGEDEEYHNEIVNIESED
ncbi:hypothetical protein Glove_452g49 [Diversispora epigaea]|uniref:Uncharacterized protein n=1 Tax=Diversispora epigaea TaxID=1348612 RepID=A0A397GPL8_9GLOM|nr:hypothetical protein Glove_452g49 [Diversispora epigaea]